MAPVHPFLDFVPVYPQHGMDEDLPGEGVQGEREPNGSGAFRSGARYDATDGPRNARLTPANAALDR